MLKNMKIFFLIYFRKDFTKFTDKLIESSKNILNS